jgi:hypothetical protein
LANLSSGGKQTAATEKSIAKRQLVNSGEPLTYSLFYWSFTAIVRHIGHGIRGTWIEPELEDSIEYLVEVAGPKLYWGHSSDRQSHCLTSPESMGAKKICPTIAVTASIHAAFPAQ